MTIKERAIIQGWNDNYIAYEAIVHGGSGDNKCAECYKSGHDSFLEWIADGGILVLLSDLDESDKQIAREKRKVLWLSDQHDACYKIFCQVCDERNAYKARAEAMERAIQKHYDDMTSECAICYMCINREARTRRRNGQFSAKEYECSGCGNGHPKWTFDKDRFAKEAGK